MAKYVVKHHFDLLDGCFYRVTMNDRTDLAKGIHQYWVGRTHAGVALQNVDFSYFPDPNGPYAKYMRDTKGLVQVKKHRFERDDVFTLQFYSKHEEFIGSVFIEPDGSFSNQIAECTDEEKKHVEKCVKEVLTAPEYQEFIIRQRKWFAEKPWEQLDGLRPEEAVAKLTELGWGIRK